MKRVGWLYEYATAIDSDGKYFGWVTKLSVVEPSMPPNSVRKISPVFILDEAEWRCRACESLMSDPCKDCAKERVK